MGREGLRARASGWVFSGRNDRAVGRGRTCVSLWMVVVKLKRVMIGGFVALCRDVGGGWVSAIRGIFEGEDVGISDVMRWD